VALLGKTKGKTKGKTRGKVARKGLPLANRPRHPAHPLMGWPNNLA